MKKMIQNLTCEKPRAKKTEIFCLKIKQSFHPLNAMKGRVVSIFKKTNISREIIDNRRSSAKTMEHEKGFALVIALGIVALMSILTIALSTILLDSIKAATNIESSNEAYYAAEAGLEMGLLANKSQAAGFEKTDTIDYASINGSTDTWKIQGLATCLLTNPLDATSCKSGEENIYYIPHQGTGDAGTKCDPLQGYIDKDHPCNWGKLSVGESVAIPLYRAVTPGTENDTNNDGILDPDELEITSLKLKIRTPCVNGSSKSDCDGGERYQLDIGADPNTSDTIMLWEIVGECKKTSDNKDCYLTQVDETSLNKGKLYIYNSEIYADLINTASDYIVLPENEFGDDNFNFQGEIINFITNQTADNSDDVSEPTKTDWEWTQRKIHKPIFHLTVIHSLSQSDGSSIAYLEYQMEIEAGRPVSDAYQTIISEGLSNNFKQSLQIKRSQGTGVLKFVIQN